MWSYKQCGSCSVITKGNQRTSWCIFPLRPHGGRKCLHNSSPLFYCAPWEKKGPLNPQLRQMLRCILCFGQAKIENMLVWFINKLKDIEIWCHDAICSKRLKSFSVSDVTEVVNILCVKRPGYQRSVARVGKINNEYQLTDHDWPCNYHTSQS